VIGISFGNGAELIFIGVVGLVEYQDGMMILNESLSYLQETYTCGYFLE